MMAIVTFSNLWLKIKLGLDAKDWPETHDNDPEPHTHEEAAKLETPSAGEIHLLIRTFRQTGCRDMELAHLLTCPLIHSRFVSSFQRRSSSHRSRFLAPFRPEPGP